MRRGVRFALAGASLAALLVPLPATASPLLELGRASDFVILGLGGDMTLSGELIINSSRSIVGDVGYGAYIVSPTNQKIDVFEGTAWVHSTADFTYTAATYQPTGGIRFGTGLTDDPVDSLLDQATQDAISASAHFSGLSPTHTLGSLGDDDDITVHSLGPVNVVSITSLLYKSDTLTIQSRPGFDDVFIFNMGSAFSFEQSFLELVGTSAGNVIFNFPNSDSMVKISKATSEFRGTILAPSSTADIEYHNPALFEGSILAYNINLHSDFNISRAAAPIPEPSTAWMFLVAGVGLGLVRRRKMRRKR